MCVTHVTAGASAEEVTVFTIYPTDNLLYIVSLVPTKIKFADSITNIPDRGKVAWPDDTIKSRRTVSRYSIRFQIEYLETEWADGLCSFPILGKCMLTTGCTGTVTKCTHEELIVLDGHWASADCSRFCGTMKECVVPDSRSKDAVFLFSSCKRPGYDFVKPVEPCTCHTVESDVNVVADNSCYTRVEYFDAISSHVVKDLYTNYVSASCDHSNRTPI